MAPCPLSQQDAEASAFAALVTADIDDVLENARIAVKISSGDSLIVDSAVDGLGISLLMVIAMRRTAESRVADEGFSSDAGVRRRAVIEETVMMRYFGAVASPLGLADRGIIIGGAVQRVEVVLEVAGGEIDAASRTAVSGYTAGAGIIVRDRAVPDSRAGPADVESAAVSGN